MHGNIINLPHVEDVAACILTPVSERLLRMEDMVLPGLLQKALRHKHSADAPFVEVPVSKRSQ